MDKTAYNLGVNLALCDAGLVKESDAGTAWQGVRRLLGRTGASIKDYFTAGSLRDALAAYGKAGIGDVTTTASKLREAAMPYLVPAGLGAAGVGGYYGAKKLFPKAFGD